MNVQYHSEDEAQKMRCSWLLSGFLSQNWLGTEEGNREEIGSQEQPMNVTR